MANWRNEIGGQLLPTGITSSGYSGSAFDCRISLPVGVLECYTPAESAVVTLEYTINPNGSRWYPVATITGIAAGAVVQVTGYYPWVRARVNAIYSGGGNTGIPIVNWQPGY